MQSLSKENIDALSPYFNANDIVIVAPLHWGLGHAARSIPIIKWLSGICHQVIIASDGEALELLKKEFPAYTFYTLPSYHIKYKYSSVLWNILTGLPEICMAYYKENKLAVDLVHQSGATVIVSDNRFGFRSKNTRNYYLTHQVNILHPNKWIASIGSKIHQWLIQRFDLCLVPDYKGEKSICPSLSQNAKIKTVFTGTISRIKKTNETSHNADILVILSGPEPQRTIIEHQLIEILAQMPAYQIVIIRGSRSPLNINVDSHHHIRCIDIALMSDINVMLNGSKLLIARSGYTTIMDIIHLDIKAIFIPTPGQTEQEYLADFHQKNPKYKKINQNELNKLQKTIKSLI